MQRLLDFLRTSIWRATCVRLNGITVNRETHPNRLFFRGMDANTPPISAPKTVYTLRIPGVYSLPTWTWETPFTLGYLLGFLHFKVRLFGWNSPSTPRLLRNGRLARAPVVGPCSESVVLMLTFHARKQMCGPQAKCQRAVAWEWSRSVPIREHPGASGPLALFGFFAWCVLVAFHFVGL